MNNLVNKNKLIVDKEDFFLADETLLAEDWLSKEDDAAWSTIYKLRIIPHNQP